MQLVTQTDDPDVQAMQAIAEDLADLRARRGPLLAEHNRLCLEGSCEHPPGYPLCARHVKTAGSEAISEAIHNLATTLGVRPSEPGPRRS
jgi:hypothetical protein